MSPEESPPWNRSSALSDLAAVDRARRESVNRTRRPGWMTAAYAATTGAAVGSGTLDSTFGWVLAGSFFLMLLGLMFHDHRTSRRRGRLITPGRGPALAFVLLVAVLMLIGQLEPPNGSQPWFSVVVGSVVALLGYGYLRWEDADTSRRLQSGDFSPDDLMP